MQRQAFDLSEQKFYDEIDDLILLHTFGDTENGIVTVDLLKKLANINI
jgi:hypothetical protein